MSTKFCRLIFGVILSLCAFPAPAQPKEVTIENGRGPITVFVPSGYIAEQPVPLVVALHGYTSNSADTNAYFNMVSQIESRGFIYFAADGTVDSDGSPFWNATDACCNFDNTDVDDSAYLRGLVDLVRADYSIDDRSIHFVGISNGGFMSYRMACDHADWVASIASLAGATFEDEANCAAEEPVHILQVHGTADGTIFYEGGCIFGNCYPSAQETVAKWAEQNGCGSETESLGPTFNLDFDNPGDETSAISYGENCLPGGSAELWTMQGSPHVPNLNGPAPGLDNQFATRTLDWLLSKRKPKALTSELEGLWFDADRAGEGYNIVSTPSGMIIFFYGYVAGERFWLISETITDSFQFGQPKVIAMRAGPTGSADLGAPEAPSSLQDWGTLTLEFTNCVSANATLEGNDGSVEGTLSLLAGSSGNNCTAFSGKNDL